MKSSPQFLKALQHRFSEALQSVKLAQALFECSCAKQAKLCSMPPELEVHARRALLPNKLNKI
jgi:hypothetical protein